MLGRLLGAGAAGGCCWLVGGGWWAGGWGGGCWGLLGARGLEGGCVLGSELQSGRLENTSTVWGIGFRV